MKVLDYLYLPDENWELTKFSNDQIKYYGFPKGWVLEISGISEKGFILGKTKKVAFLLGGQIHLFIGKVMNVEPAPEGSKIILLEITSKSKGKKTVATMNEKSISYEFRCLQDDRGIINEKIEW